MELIYILTSAALVYSVIRIVTSRSMEKVNVAFAGVCDGSDEVIKIHKDRNKTVFTEGENIVDLSMYKKFYISGHSLEKAGLEDKSFVYTSEARELKSDNIYGRFVIFRYDIDRVKEEHPEMVAKAKGFKARKAITTIATQLTEDDFRKNIQAIIYADDEIGNKDAFMNELWSKYCFAFGYYQNDEMLIVSITYKEGVRKDYSFHSRNFLEGIVEYKSLS